MRRHLRIWLPSAAASLLLATAPSWNPTPWLADLEQLRTAIDERYPNRDWLTRQREVSLDRWFDGAASAIRRSRNDADARRALDAIVTRFNDGHVLLRWPEPREVAAAEPAHAIASPPSTVARFCAARGYDAGQVTAGTASALPGYRAIDGGGPFGTGIVSAAGTTVGIVRIGVFSPQGYPSLCERAVADAGIALEKPCDATCDDHILTQAYALMTRGLIGTVERLEKAGAQVLLVDLTRNGGGSEWAEAAARIVSPVSLRSAPIGVVRGEAWVRRWRDLATRLRREGTMAARSDRAMLADLAKRADATADGLQPCSGPTCSHLAPAGYASGLLPELAAGRLDGRKWGAEVFSAAQYPYRDGVWKGGVIVLVDSETWSAAEQFTALLRDNSAAVVIGTRTGGAGCGHLYGKEPITLMHSKAVLEIPNCARFRKDGSNEVGGIVPDVPTGARWNDRAAYAGRLTAARLPEAIARATAVRAPEAR